MDATTDRPPTLTGKNVILRRPREQDIEDRLSYGRNAEIVRMFGGDATNLKPFTREEAIAQYRAAVSNPLAWTIEHAGRYIGVIRLTLNEADRRARLAIGIHDASKLGKGLGTEATQLVLDYAFAELHLQ